MRSSSVTCMNCWRCQKKHVANTALVQTLQVDTFEPLIWKCQPGPKFTDDLRTILRQFRTYDNLMTTGEITEHYDICLKTYLQTTSYDHLLDVLRQLGPIWILR